MLSKLAVYSVEWSDGYASNWTAFDPIIAIKRAIKERNTFTDGTEGVRWHARHIERVALLCVLHKCPRDTVFNATVPEKSDDVDADLTLDGSSLEQELDI